MWPQFFDAVELADVHVPPVGELAHERERLGPDAADQDRDAVNWFRCLLRVLEVVELAVVVDGLAGPERAHDFEGFPQPLDAVTRLGRTDTEGRELLDHGSPPDTEVEATAGCVIDRHRLSS